MKQVVLFRCPKREKIPSVSGCNAPVLSWTPACAAHLLSMSSLSFLGSLRPGARGHPFLVKTPQGVPRPRPKENSGTRRPMELTVHSFLLPR